MKCYQIVGFELFNEMKVNKKKKTKKKKQKKNKQKIK